MSMRCASRARFPADHLPLLRWLMFTGVTVFGFVLAWHYGLFHLMLASDKTYISAIIGVLYIAASRTASCARDDLARARQRAARLRAGEPGAPASGWSGRTW